MQRGEDEEMESDDGGSRVSGEREDEFGDVLAGIGFDVGDGGEGGGFAGFHAHAAEVDGAS